MKSVVFDKRYEKEPLYPGFKEEGGCCGRDICWWEWPRDSLPAAYCRETSMHGLKYVAEPKRHLSERICWLIAFLIGVMAAAYLINDVWENYHKNPVIVSFQPTETDIKDIPFPAVTICNMNRFPKSLYLQLLEAAENSEDEQARLDANTDLEFLKSVCGTQHSFAQKFEFAAHRGEIDSILIDKTALNHTKVSLEIFSLLIEKTMPCEELIRLCIWAEQKQNCSELFKPIVTEYGKCCTFNILPLPLLLSQNTVTRYNDSFGSVNLQTKKPIPPRWDAAELNKWKQWDYTNDGFILKPNLERPYRQSRAGVPFGLSILIDSNADEYFCPSSDSEGFRIVLHTALEMPPVQNWGVAIGMGKEIFMEIMPRMTIADAKIFAFPYEKRKCFSQSEKSLKFYNAYTTSNCLDECIADLTAKECDCAFYYMQRGPETRVCSSIPGSVDYKCASDTQSNLTKHFRNSCENCDSLCTDIFYTVEQTQADLQNTKQLWSDPREGDAPSWANHSLSIVHLYFGTDALVPQIRSQLYAPVDLIANTGGLLGLCLGFSALSAIEFVYFFTVRYFWQSIRQRTIGRRIANKFINAVWRTNQKQAGVFGSGLATNEITLGFAGTHKRGHFDGGKTRVIDVDKNILPCYPAYGFSNSGSGPQVTQFQNNQQSRGSGQGQGPGQNRNRNISNVISPFVNRSGFDMQENNGRNLNSNFYSSNNY